MNYIATWFYKESKDEASFYPQGGGKGDSPLLHSIYMQIQVPFFVTFRHFNPDAHLLFFTNLEASMPASVPSGSIPQAQSKSYHPPLPEPAT